MCPVTNTPQNLQHGAIGIWKTCLSTYDPQTIKDPEVLCTHKAVLMVEYSSAIEDVLIRGRVGLVALVQREVSSSLGNCVSSPVGNPGCPQGFLIHDLSLIILVECYMWEDFFLLYLLTFSLFTVPNFDYDVF